MKTIGFLQQENRQGGGPGRLFDARKEDQDIFLII